MYVQDAIQIIFMFRDHQSTYLSKLNVNAKTLWLLFDFLSFY